MTLSRLALVVLVVAETANLDGLGEQRGLPLVLIGLILLAGACALWGVRRGELRPGWSPVLPALALYTAAIGATAVVAPQPGAGQDMFVGTVVDLVWFAVLLVLLSAPGAPMLAGASFVGTLAALALLAVLQEFLVGNDFTFGGLSQVPLSTDLGSVTARHSGPEQDVNFWGRVLVLGVPLAVGLWAGSAPVRRWCWVGCAVLVSTGVYLTQSRGALLALAVGLVAWPLLAARRYRQLLLGLPVLLAVALAVPGVGSRLATVTQLGPSPLTLPDPSLQGRRDAQRAALQMFWDDPVFGVGPGRFEQVTTAYQRRLPFEVSDVFAPHNLYLQFAAEGGLVLLGAWLALLATGAFVANRARVLLQGAGGPEPPLVAGVLAALVAWSTASIFLHLASLRTFLLVVGVGAAVDLLARRRDARRPAGVPASSGGPTSTGSRAR